MSKRTDRSTSSSSNSSSSTKSPPCRKLKCDIEEMANDSPKENSVSLSQLLDKLNNMEDRIEDHLGGLKSELSILRCEIKQEMESVKTKMASLETSLNTAWDTISDVQGELKAIKSLKKDFEALRDNQNSEANKLKRQQQLLDQQCTEIEDLMHLSMLSPRVGGAGYPREFDSDSFPLGQDFDSGHCPWVGNLTWQPSWMAERTWK